MPLQPNTATSLLLSISLLHGASPEFSAVADNNQRLESDLSTGFLILAWSQHENSAFDLTLIRFDLGLGYVYFQLTSIYCCCLLNPLSFRVSFRCPPCKMIAPHFNELSEKNKDAVFVKVDVDDAADIASHFGISAMPTFKFIKNGEIVDELQGANLPVLQAKVVKHK